MIIRIRNSRWAKVFTIIMGLQLLIFSVVPQNVMALTGGPSQPEFSSFTPVGVSDMVDLFTGDFQYNIPLMDVGGYPINLSYASGIGMEQQASNVGLGWRLNAGGEINRGMRGIPDDFNATDKIVKRSNMKPNITAGANLTLPPEIVGKELELKKIGTVDLSLSFGIFFNTYKGLGYSFGINPVLDIGGSDKNPLNVGLGVSANSQSGVAINPRLSMQGQFQGNEGEQNIGMNGSLGFGGSYSSRAGLKAIAFDASIRSNTKLDGSKNTAEELKKKGSFSVGSTLPVGMSTYIPSVQNAMRSNSLSANFGAGAEGFWALGKTKIGGYYNEQRLKEKVVEHPAAGYLYAGDATDNSMHDFNREKDGSVNRSTPHVAMAQATYDTYNVTGQGVGGSYRPYRDAGTVHDPFVQSGSHGGSLGVDGGATQLLKVGINASYNYNTSTSGRWSSDRPNSNIEYKGNDAISNKPRSYEPFYFKNAGEFSIVNDDYIQQIGDTDPMRVEITKNGKSVNNFKKRRDLSTVVEDNHPINSLKRFERERRDQPMTVLTASVADVFGVTGMRSFSENNGTGVYSSLPVNRVDNNRKAHHISEITINRNDGARYVYGNQQYNYIQEETSFNVEGNPNCVTGFVPYEVGVDNTENNNKGVDHFYSSTEMPGYGTAYQLTAVLSADYVDIDNNGPSDDDLGNYTKFNYTRVHGGANPYRWRNPYGQGVANFSEGYKSRDQDDKGNYVYGEKEIWDIHSIETKLYIAEFYYSDRKDAFDVAGRDGGQGSRTLKKLDRIELYAKCDRAGNSAAEPLKVVHFVYDYSQCKGIPSNNTNIGLTNNELSNEGGKLTLKKVFFTYQKSRKGEFSPYQFNYNGFNPDYDFRGNDRWGNYKENKATSCNVASGLLSNIDNPYVEQDKITADNNTSAWHLDNIQLPSGGVINVAYESDDYAYVQNKRATRMFNVLGFSDSQTGDIKTELYENTGTSNKPYLFFDVAQDTDANNFKERYIGEGQDEIKQLFYKFLMDINGDQRYEFVSGYVPVANYGIVDNGGLKGWIKLDPVNIKDNGTLSGKIHPISKTTMQFARLNMPEIIFGQEDKQLDPGLTLFNFILGTIKDITQMIVGANRYLATLGYGKHVKVDKSFIRLQTPNYTKLGGGIRVKEIKINDSWSSMTNAKGNNVDNFDYGQTYDYSTTNGRGAVISSGVAAYEPFIGNEENPLRQPVAYSTAAALAPDAAYYQETPYGESFYPSPTVGYSQVRVTNLSRTGVSRTATGYVQHEFYTAKDFPVKVRRPYTDKQIERSGLLGNLFKVNAKDNLTISQSHAIELNDMHGKQKAQWVYGEEQSEPISGVKYFYKTQSGNQLSNKIDVINKDGVVMTSQRAGLEIDMINDERESKQFTFGVTVSTNIDVSLVPIPIVPFPLPLPSSWPSITRETTRYRSVSNTKVVTRYGILERTEAYDLGSMVSTDNLAWDGETGQVLLTRTQNDFEDPIYSFTYPAHWGYDGMGQAYKNIGVTTQLALLGNGVYSLTNADYIIAAGDEVAVNGGRYWVSEVSIDGNQITLIDENGDLYNAGDNDNMVVLRSGRRNQHSTPIGTVTTLTNPINGNQLAFKEVLNAGAVEFKEEWDDFCECEDLLASANPYVTGVKGNYRAHRSNLFLTGRNQSSENRNTNIREDGTFNEFDPFWNPNSNPLKNKGNWLINRGQWTFTSGVTLFSPFGFELENRDALGRYSAADYRYKNSLPTAVASNAQYKEIGFDGFEDYDCDNCLDDHFSFKEVVGVNNENISEDEAHTGRRSIKVGAGQTLEVEKVIKPCNQ